MTDRIARRQDRGAALFAWWESYALIILSLGDLALTVALIRSGKAVEANPLLSTYLDYGVEWFLVAKAVLFCLIPVGMVEWIRERFPARQAGLRAILRTGLAAYLVLYIIGIVLANGWSR